MKKTALKPWFALVSICGLVVLGGCAEAPTVDSVEPAQLAVDRAIEAKAGEYAPLELRLAQEKLAGARRAMNEEEYEEAQRLADAAQVDAQLAEAKAKSETAREEAQAIQLTIDSLRQEAEQREIDQ